ncbi:MAG: CRISPR system precrRNA processing endoribonuclease RAMP protein Cas6, partial [Thermodesulfovibrionales bacterium]|nr:CRISPR system precrRNA processing endoribonuclease RAMP protein Cas6 [Thermodesulfovibrionales bacterium]
MILLNLTFNTLKPIGNLPYYHGIHWSALLREIMSEYLPYGMNLTTSGISIQTLESGRLWYEEADTINLGISFPDSLRNAIAKLIATFNDKPIGEGHFMPSINLVLEDVRCRISGKSEPEDWEVLNHIHLLPEIKELTKLSEFTIQFITPLRLPRPEGSKVIGHRFCDSEYFEDPLNNPIKHLLARIRTPEPYHSRDIDAKVIYCNLHWIDVSYGKKEQKTIGGIVGKIKFTGNLKEEEASNLVLGQYTGIGKNPAFGFGYYFIPEIMGVSLIRSLKRGESILQYAFSTSQVKTSLMSLPN